MAVDFSDPASGFRHSEVISFINNEILTNGGGQDFYVAFRSQPWKEVEDRLLTILVDQQLPCTIKRSCAWSALALGVRAAAGQQEQQARLVQWLCKQVSEREAAALVLASELQQLREERDQMAAQLNLTGATLQKVLFEHDVLRGQLLQLERSAQFAPLTHETVPGPPPEQLGATAGPLIAGQQIDTMAMGMHTRLNCEVQIPAPADALNVPGSLNPWAQAMQPPLPMGVPNAVPFYAPLPAAVSFLPSLPPARAAVRPLQMPPLGISPPGPRASEGFQEEMAPLCYQSSYTQEEGCGNIQYIVPLENIRNLSCNENLQWSQGMAPLMESVSLETGTENPQEMITVGAGSSQSQEEGPQKPQVTSLGDSWSFGRRENQKNQQPLGQNEPKGKKASDSQRQEKLAPGSSPGNWDCQRCKAMNFSACKFCYKCRKVRRPFESGGLDPGKTH